VGLIGFTANPISTAPTQQSIGGARFLPTGDRSFSFLVTYAVDSLTFHAAIGMQKGTLRSVRTGPPAPSFQGLANPPNGRYVPKRSNSRTAGPCLKHFWAVATEHLAFYPLGLSCVSAGAAVSISVILLWRLDLARRKSRL